MALKKRLRSASSDSPGQRESGRRSSDDRQSHSAVRIGDPHHPLELEQQHYNVFYVPQAVGSPLVPHQDDFVIPCSIQSVLGFGGLLPSGNLFAIVLFSKVPLPRETANLFKTLALSVKLAILPFDGRAVFAAQPSAPLREECRVVINTRTNEDVPHSVA